MIQGQHEELHFYLREIRSDERSSLSVLSSMVAPRTKVLDLGCGSGALGQHLAATHGCIVDGVTLSAVEAEHARPHYQRIEVADLETTDLLRLFEGQRYDAIVCADVLEHLRRPERILQTCGELLTPTGRLLFSVPNASYAGLTLDLMHGKFRYRAEGLLDKTHVRFFTRHSLSALLKENGWSVDSLQSIQRELWDSEFEHTPDTLPPAVARYMLAQPDALTYQFIGVAHPSAALETSSSVEEQQSGEHQNATFTAQLYWGRAGQYDEAHKGVAQGIIGEQRQTLRFQLPVLTEAALRLRLDPADRPGFLHLHSLQLRDARNCIQWHWNAHNQTCTLSSQPHQQIGWGPSFATAPNTVLLLLTGDDPWVELPISADILAQCLKEPGSVLDVELGWPMSADYVASAELFRTLQMQANHTESSLAKLQQAHRHALEEMAKLLPMEHENLRLRGQHHILNSQIQQLQAHVHNLENSRIFRVTRPLAHFKQKITLLFKSSPLDTETTPRAPIPPAPPPPPEAQPSASPGVHEFLPPCAPQTIEPASIVDVIIPVYKGQADTKRCLTSVLNGTQRTPIRIVVINDASPDPDLAEWLRQQASQEPRIVLLENDSNLGFVQTANRGMALSANHDVLLLNSDTEVAGDWLDRLRQAAYRHPDIGTATPLSNNATICSYPRYCESNSLPTGHDTASIDALCAQINSGASVQIPTAVGFCMYIRRDCLTQTGLFDSEHFGLGYGEENDFCMRASRHSWRHVLAMDTYVRHIGGVSFGSAKSRREADAQELLRKLHPAYEGLINAHVQADPARPWREALDIARLQNSPRPRILAVLHGIGGGTRRHAQELSIHFKDRADFLTLTPLADHRVRLQWDAPNEAFTREYHALHQTAELLAILRQIGVAHVHYHHLLGLNPSLMLLPEQLQVTYDFTAHDYYNACPQIALVDENQSYCGERGIAQCTECVRGRPSPTGETIEDWRLRHRLFLNGARTVLTPSRDAARRMTRYFPAANIRYAPHLDMAPDTALPTPAPRTLDAGANLRVFIIGAVSRIKGGDTMEAVSLEAARMQAPIELHLLGYPHHPMRQQPHASLSVHGAYEDADLPRLLQRLQPDLVWFPARWPETYSYTLSACLQAGLPILATDLGAFPERLSGRAWSWIQPWNTPPGDWLALMLRLRQQHYVNAVPPLPAPSLHIALADDQLPAWSYDRDYLAALVPSSQPH